MDPMPEIPDHLKVDSPEPLDEETAINLIKSEMENYLLYDNGKTRIFALPPEMNKFAAVEGDPVELGKEFAVFAAFDDKGLAARTSVIMVPHIEGTWIREDYRKGRLARRMVKLIEQGTKETGNSSLFAFAEQSNAEVNDYLARMGYVLQPLNVWVKDLGTPKTPDETQLDEE